MSSQCSREFWVLSGKSVMGMERGTELEQSFHGGDGRESLE